MVSASPPPRATLANAGTPNNTVYIRNLEESIAIPLLKNTLESIFTQYGTIIDIVAKKNLRAKGQAFVVFDTVDAAEKAIREVQGFSLFEKPMVLQFAKAKSDAFVKATGTDEELDAHKRRRMAEKGGLLGWCGVWVCTGEGDEDVYRRLVGEEEFNKRKLAAEEAQKSLKRPPPGAAATAPNTTNPTAAESGRPAKKAATGLKSTNAAAAPSIPDEYLPPNKVLFLQQLPAEATADLLTSMFGRFEGFKEVRMVPGRKGLAFVEYEHQEGSISAKEAMAGSVLVQGTGPIKVTYQRQ